MATDAGPAVPEPKNHLTKLPSELQHIIIGYLFPAHDADKAYQPPPYNPRETKPAFHTLDFLAATCKSLRGEIMQWSLHFLTQHRNITRYKALKTAKLQAQRNFLRGRGGLLTWSEKNCIFCGKASTRTAIMMNSLHCCELCDKEQWPDKITKSDAKKLFDLRDHHLLPHLHHSPSSAKLLAKHPGGLPKLRYGTWMSVNGPATMFFRKDVKALAVLAHGDLKAHLDKRQADKEERSRKLKVTKERKEAARLRDPQVLMGRLTELINDGMRDPTSMALAYEDYHLSTLHNELISHGMRAPTPAILSDEDDQLSALLNEFGSRIEDEGISMTGDNFDDDIYSLELH